MLLQDLRVDQSGQNNPDAIGRLSLKHDLHADQRTVERRPNRASSPALLTRQAFPRRWRRTRLVRRGALVGLTVCARRYGAKGEAGCGDWMWRIRQNHPGQRTSGAP